MFFFRTKNSYGKEINNYSTAVISFGNHNCKSTKVDETQTGVLQSTSLSSV